ncbi:hypothetical protein [Kordia sp.]|uniref:hypothetical protein n=1 Tax=Kordia sp. TaxID=1965332 RepID=UPI0025C4A549|nr:hypothetical protein [Kordia sp.]MCH2194125.1 hypothetical protein [Kordia sp.]
MKRFLASVVFLLITFSCFSQGLNEYKYAVIPYKFDFLNKHDKYRVNTLVRHLFKKEGFHVLYDNQDFPDELVADRCMAFYVDIKNDSNIFTTKMSFILRDCSNKIIMETPIGRSKIKAYEKAYNQALRRAFEHIQAENYSYEPKKKEVVEVPPPPSPVVVKETPKKVVNPKVEEVVEVEATVKETVTKKPMKETVAETANTVLYAQAIENGYQLVDTTPKVVMILLKTGAPNVYLVKGKDATVYKENGKWILSKSSGSGIQKSTLDIKF